MSVRHRIGRSVSAVLVMPLVLALAACRSSSAPGGDSVFELRAENALFWAVRREGDAEPALYVLGSVHLLDQPIALGPRIEGAFERATTLVLEVDLGSLTEDEARELQIRHGALGRGETLEDLVEPATIDLLETWLRERGASDEQIHAYTRLRPWLIATNLVAYSAERAGDRMRYGVDRYFQEHAGSRQVVGLETADEQFYAMSSHSDRTQELLLLQVLHGTGEGGAPRALLEAWKRGDDRAIEAIVFGDDSQEFADFYETIYAARNERMADGLAELLDREPREGVSFAVLGAAHLVGDADVIDLLQAYGYEAERLR